MNTNKSFKEMKAQARAALNGHYGIAVLIFINVEILTLLPTLLVINFFPNNNLAEIITSEVVSFILNVFVGVIEAGLCLVYLKFITHQNVSVSDIYSGFKENRNSCMTISLVFAAITEICTMPYIVFSSYTLYIGSNEYLLYENLMLLACMAIAFLIRIPIAQSFFVIIDFPDLTGMEAVKRSIKMMKHNYGRFLGFMLSFFPLILLSVLSLGLGLLWVIPYMYAATAVFYLDLAKNM